MIIINDIRLVSTKCRIYWTNAALSYRCSCMGHAFIDAVYLYNDTRIEVVFKCDDLLDEAVGWYMTEHGMEKGEDGVWRDKVNNE